jgi:hypothetical protein
VLDSILNIDVSCFANYDSPANPRSVNLLQWLISAKYTRQVQAIRNIEDKEIRDKIKATLPAITPSGLFSYRSKDCLIRHSGFIQFDIDQKGNETIANYKELKKEICKIPNVAYCGLSVSGKGFWGLIPVENPERHNLYFKYIEKWFEARGLLIDSAPKSVCSLRGYSYDPEAYFNDKAIVLQKFFVEPAKKNVQLNIKRQDSSIFLQARNFALNKTGEFRDGNRHNFIFHLCCYLCYKGVIRHDAENWIFENLLPQNEVGSNCILYPFENYSPGDLKATKEEVREKKQANEPDKTSHLKIIKPIPPNRRMATHYCENWDSELADLEKFFSYITLPAPPFVLDNCTTIIDYSIFFQSHFETLKANNGNQTFLPFLDRMREMKIKTRHSLVI